MKRVLTFGATCLDFLAAVDHFPSADEKLRTSSLTVTVGGNAANTSRCLSRLGIQVKLIGRIGGDPNGQKILDELRSESNIDTSSMLIDSSMEISPMSYVIVDRNGKSRTCLYSAKNEQILIEDVRLDWLNQIDFLHFDSRSTAAAVHLAKLARNKNLLCSLDLERSRPHLIELIPLMNFIVMSENYSKNFTEDQSFIDTAVKILQENRENCRFVIVTCGRNGSVLIERNSDASIKTEIDDEQVRHEVQRINDENFSLWFCRATEIDENQIIDTNGCGDVFIGAIIFALIEKPNWMKSQLLRFASFIAMCKLKDFGAKSTLPFIEQIDMKMFQ